MCFHKRMLSTFLESFLGTRSEQKTQLALCSWLYYSFTTSSLCLQDYICFFSFILFYYFYLTTRVISLFLFNVNLICVVSFCFSPFSLWLVNSGQHSLPSSNRFVFLLHLFLCFRTWVVFLFPGFLHKSGAVITSHWRTLLWVSLLFWLPEGLIWYQRPAATHLKL